ncbi:MAG: O-antigen ligase family protein [Roseofilum sp. Belize BBD 4]|uniref:O-antigen ligase family protein n=1 Tax=Roseofilum sp. Belize BBD 4 TaxID=2821500 RepID=UPI001B04BA09|nr:O-antigen ligase family protein [Roseofilum sp. Belize BBD 4]MBP0032831.1 O-antigen ligase family protein [Roseofilum sp. Belize BBD 4]
MARMIRELLLGNPILLLLLGLLGFVSTLLFFHLSSKSQKIGSFLNHSFAYIFIILSPVLIQPPLNYLHPINIARQPSKQILNLLPLFFYPLVFTVLWSKLHFFLKNLIQLSSIILKKNPGFLFYIFLPLLSSAWSLAPRPTLEFGFAISITTFLSLYIASQYNWIELSKILRFSYLFIGLFSYIKQPPGSGDWTGITLSKNALGGILSICTALWFLEYSQGNKEAKSRYLALLFTGISFFLVRTGRSAGALISTIIIIAILLSLNFVKKLNFRWALTCIVVMMALNICVGLIVIENLEAIFTSLEKDMTLTGRTIIWPLILEEIYKSPLLGYGFGGFWQNWRGDDSPGYAIMTENGWSPPNAHNGFIDIFLAFGIIGLTLFVLSFINNLLNAVYYLIQEKLQLSGVPIIFIMYIILNNITESTLAGNNHVWSVYVMMTVRLCIDTLDKNKEKLNN